MYSHWGRAFLWNPSLTFCSRVHNKLAIESMQKSVTATTRQQIRSHWFFLLPYVPFCSVIEMKLNYMPVHFVKCSVDNGKMENLYYLFIQCCSREILEWEHLESKRKWFATIYWRFIEFRDGDTYPFQHFYKGNFLENPQHPHFTQYRSDTFYFYHSLTKDESKRREFEMFSCISFDSYSLTSPQMSLLLQWNVRDNINFKSFDIFFSVSLLYVFQFYASLFTRYIYKKKLKIMEITIGVMDTMRMLSFSRIIRNSFGKMIDKMINQFHLSNFTRYKFKCFKFESFLKLLNLRH